MWDGVLGNVLFLYSLMFVAFLPRVTYRTTAQADAFKDLCPLFLHSVVGWFGLVIALRPQTPKHIY
jgi:hypothetical protein